MPRVLLLGSADRTSLALARALGRSGITVDVGGIDIGSAANRSRYVTKVLKLGNVGVDVAGCVQALMDQLSAVGYDQLIPVTDAACELCADSRESIDRLTRLALPQPRAYEIAHDKRQTLQLAQQLQIPVPDFSAVSKLEDLAPYLDERHLYPCFAKPIYSAKLNGNRIDRFRAQRVHGPGELEEFCRFHLEKAPVMVQELCFGVGAGVYVLAEEGKILSSVQQLRLHEPRTGGSSSYRMTTPMDPGLFEYSRKLISACGWSGAAMLEFKGDPAAGRWVLMEINGRYWGSLALTIRAGLNFPAWWYERSVSGHAGQEFSEVRPRLGIRQRNLKKDIGWLAREMRGGRHRLRTAITWLADFRHVLTGNERWDNEAFGDPLPAVWDWVLTAAPHVARAGRMLTRQFNALHYRRRETQSVERALEILATDNPRILFVCRGNIYRSAFSEHYLKQVYGLDQVRSAGTLNLVDRMVPEVVERITAQKCDVQLSSHRSTWLDSDLLTWADVVFVMDYRNLMQVKEIGVTSAPILLLGSLTGAGAIADPYGKSPEFVERTLSELKPALDKVAEHVCRIHTSVR